MSIQHLCQKCGAPYASNEDCRACQTAMASQLVAQERRRVAVMHEMELAARNAPANKRFTVLTPGGKEIR